MSKFILFAAILGLTGCAHGVACDGNQSDYDAAFEDCRADGQRDVCAGAERGASYAQGSHDLCSDGLGDQSAQGCEAGYAEGYDVGCET
jgi:hypothetical protein